MDMFVNKPVLWILEKLRNNFLLQNDQFFTRELNFSGKSSKSPFVTDKYLRK